MVLGHEAMIRRLSASLAGRGIEVVRTMTVPKAESFDVAVVDSLVDEAEAVCRCIKQVCGVPVVLIVRGRQTDWEKLQSLDTDAYIPEGASGAEVAARLRAVVRRHHHAAEREIKDEIIGSN